jgi:hypothetical protein
MHISSTGIVVPPPSSVTLGERLALATFSGLVGLVLGAVFALILAASIPGAHFSNKTPLFFSAVFAVVGLSAGASVADFIPMWFHTLLALIGQGELETGAFSPRWAVTLLLGLLAVAVALSVL